MEAILTTLAMYACVVVCIRLAQDDETDIPSDLVDRRYGMEEINEKETR